MNKQQIEEFINYAIKQLLENDSVLLNLDVSERAVMFHFARYIREKVPADLDVDCEYNRHFSNKKQLLYLRGKLDMENDYAVLPDILIHKRNSDDQNVLVVEMKKYGEDIEADIRKLEAFKNEPYSYDFAIQIVIGNPDSETGVDFRFV